MKMSVLRNFIPINNPIEKISKKKRPFGQRDFREREREWTFVHVKICLMQSVT